METLIRTAIIFDEWHTAAEIMVKLYFQYVEGDNEESKALFNRYIKILPIEALHILNDTFSKYYTEFKPLIRLLDAIEKEPEM